MDVSQLPAEILEIIFHHLPPVSLLSCSQATPWFAQLINRDVFLDKYCQKILYADWIKVDMLDTARKSFPLILELRYLEAVAKCHTNLTIHGNDRLHSIGIFIFTLITWLDQKLQARVAERSQCIECHGTGFLRSLVSNSDARQLFVRFAIFVPKFVIVSLMHNQRISFCGEKPYNLDFLLQNSNAVHQSYIEDFDCKFCLEIILFEPGGFMVFMAACVLVGEDSWIGWTGLVDYVSFRHHRTESSCKLAISTPRDENQKAMTETFKYFTEYLETDRISFHGWNTSAVLSSQEPLGVRFRLLLENLARHVNKETERLRLQDDIKNKLKQYLDGLLQQKSSLGHIDAGKRSSTLFVSILRYFHRVLNNIFYTECMKYLTDKDCAEYLVHSDKKRKGIPRLSPFAQFSKQLSIHNLSPKLWPSHLLTQAIKSAPVISRLVQLDIVLLVKGLHCQPVSNKIRQFLTDQTNSCGLTCDKSQLLYPPLGCLVRY